MRVLLQSIKTALKEMIQYKWGFMLSLIGDPIIMLINIALFSSIFNNQNADNILGYDLSQMIWYFTGVIFIWYFIYNFADTRMANKIISGELAIDLLKPVSLFKLELAYAIGLRINGVLFEFLPGLLLYSMLFYPDFLSVWSLLRFFLVIGFAFFLFFNINFMIGLSAFIIKSNFSLQSIKLIVISLTAGAYIPLEFFPAWFNNVNQFLPFQYIFYWPIQVFLNRENTGHVNVFLKIVGIQALWIIIIYIGNKFFWKRAIKKFGAVGG